MDNNTWLLLTVPALVIAFWVAFPAVLFIIMMILFLTPFRIAWKVFKWAWSK